MKIYIKGRYDYGKGVSAVVVVDGEKKLYESAKAWESKTMTYSGNEFAVDVFNCEIMAAICGILVAKKHKAKEVTLYANTRVQKWYTDLCYPDNRMLMQVFEHESRGIKVNAEYIAKKSDDPYNQLINQLAEQAR